MYRRGDDGGCVPPGRHHQGRAQGGGGLVRRRSTVRTDHAPLGRVPGDGHELHVPEHDGFQRGHQPSGTCRRLPTREACSRAPTSFYRDLSGWTFADNANTTGMFTGADTWLTVKSRTDGFDSKDGPPGAWVFNTCLENERVENGLCAPCTGGGTRAAGDDPAAGDTSCAFPDSAALKAAVDNCIAVDPTGVACCSHGADCGAAGTVEMADWDVSLVTSMSELVQWQGAVQRGYIAVGHLERHDHVQDVQRSRRVRSRYR